MLAMGHENVDQYFTGVFMRHCALNYDCLLSNSLHHKLPKTFVKAAWIMGGGPGRLTFGATKFKNSGNSGASLKAWWSYTILQWEARKS